MLTFVGTEIEKKMYRKRINFRLNLITRGQKICISRGFNFANQLFS